MTDQILKNDVLGWDIINAVAVDEAQHNTTHFLTSGNLDNDIFMFLEVIGVNKSTEFLGTPYIMNGHLNMIPPCEIGTIVF